MTETYAVEKTATPLISIVMGSQSDWECMRAAHEICVEMEVSHEYRVLSAHRTPVDMMEYAQNVEQRGLQVIIAGAGGAAHLPGMIASITSLPVIGVPVDSHLHGLDSLLSIVQMPAGVPVATVAIGAARNAAILAISILALQDSVLQKKLLDFKQKLASGTRQQKLD